MKNTMIRFLLLLTVLVTVTQTVGAAGPLAPTAAQKQITSEMGSDTGNGGYSDSIDLNIRGYLSGSFPYWCNAVQGWLDDIKHMIAFPKTDAARRRFIVESIEAILSSYKQGALPMQPLTYSLLSRSLMIEKIFPKGKKNEFSLGDQVAVVVLLHMIDVSKEVNAKFDVPKLLPYYERFSTCTRGCGEFDYSAFYVDYISSAITVLEEFHKPAIPTLARGTLLDAMAYDVWELQALNHVLVWMISDIQKDIFRRGLECVLMRLQTVQRRLSLYLSEQAKEPFDDRTMRIYAEEALTETLAVLGGYQYTNGHGHCSGPRR